MYAFLSKVFGRKKDDRDASSSSQPVLGPGELLGGRFEAVSPNVSPVPPFLELDPKSQEAKDKEKEKDPGFSFFKGKWRPASPDVKPSRKLDVLPHLSLNFQELKTVSATPDLGLLFTTDQLLSDAVIGQRRLNPLEALVLIQACSQAIIAKGLETLGIMHPHWYAASHNIQRRVISHFIYLSNLENATSIPSPVSLKSPLTAFETEVNDTFSPHDIAAILRWGLRHVQIEGDSLGTDDAWYKVFLEAEGTAGYPPKAFSEKLAPLLPTAHFRLLTATLEIFSSLAAHAEVNGTSGSKLCKMFGLWLLTAHRVEDKDDWRSFYARWERTGRMLEHLFLSRIRDESTDQRMPIRLLELVHKYPYTKGLSAPNTDLPLLPRPPFSTRLHDAFFVRIETELPYGRRKPSSKLHPLSLLADAFSTKVEEGEYADLWAKITTASKEGDNPSFSDIFTYDTLRFLSLVPEEPTGHEVRSPTFSLISPVSPQRGSVFVDDADKPEAVVAGHSKSPTQSQFSPMTPLSPLTNNIGSDWAQFSASGFLEVNPSTIPLASTLLDTDIERTTPPEAIIPLSRKSSRRSKAASPSSPRKSVDLTRSGIETSEAKPENVEEQKTIIKASQLQIIELDEAFIDFWSDSLLDPISADWPTFIICKFKSSLVPGLTFGVAEKGQKQKTIQWLVLEHVYNIRAPPVLSVPSIVETVRPRSSSPGSQSTSGRKRFSFWSVSRTASGSSVTGKKKDQELRVGEMGELLEEHRNETKESMFKVKSPIFRSRKSMDAIQKPIETMRKSVIKPTEESKIDEETAAVAAVATGVVVASAAVIASGLPTPIESVTTKAEADHSTDIPAMEVFSTPTAVTAETVVSSSEPIVKDDDKPISTALPDVVPSPEAKPLESENVESTVIAAEVGTKEIHSELELQPKMTEAEPALLVAEGSVIVGDTTDSKDRPTPQFSDLEPEAIAVEDVVETGGHVETDPISVTQDVPVAIVVEPEVASISDSATITPQAPATTESIEVEEVVSVLAQDGLIAAPLVSEAVIPEPETEIEAPVKSEFTSTMEESPALFTSDLETSQGIDPLAESESTNVEKAVTQPEIIEIQSKLEPKAVEAEHVFSLVENIATDVVSEKTSNSVPVHDVAQHTHEVAAQEVSQIQSNDVFVAEDVADHKEDQLDVTTASTELEGFVAAEDTKANETIINELKDDSASDPAFDEPKDEIEAAAEPVPASVEQDIPPSIEYEPETTQSDEPAPATGTSSAIALVEDTPISLELQSGLEQENTTQELVVGVVSKDAHEAEAEVTADTHGTEALIAAPTTANDLVAAESAETEQLVIPTTEGDSANEGSVEAERLATTEDLSSMDEVELEATHASPEAGTTLNMELHEVDDTVPAAVDNLPDNHTNLHNVSTPVSLPLEPEIILIKTDVESQVPVAAAPIPTVPIDAEVQPSLTEVAPNAQKDIEVGTRVDDSNIEGEPILESDIVHHIEAKVVAEGPLESVPASSKEESQVAELEPEVDFVVPVVAEPSVIAQVEGENLSPEIESEAAIAQGSSETIPILEDEPASVVNIEDQIVAPVDIRSEHVTLVDASSTDEPVEAILPSNIEESPDAPAPMVESLADEMVEDHIIPAVDAVVPETQVLGKGELVTTTEEPAVSVELNLGHAASILPQEHPSESEQPITHEEAPPITSNSSAVPNSEVNVSIAAETEPEILPINSVSKEEVPTLEAEEQHTLLSSETRSAADIGMKDEVIPLAIVEPVLEVVAPVSEAPELQAQHTPEEPSDRAAEVEPQIIPTTLEESRAHIDEGRPVSATLQDDTSFNLSEAVYTASLEAEFLPLEEEPAMIVESEPDTLHKATSSTETLDVEVQPEAQVLEETFNPVKADTDVADVDILSETQPSMVIDDDLNSTVESVLIPSHGPATEENDIPKSTVIQGAQTDIDAAATICPTQDKTAAEVKGDDIEEVSTEASNRAEGTALSPQTENLFDGAGSGTDPIVEQVVRDVQTFDPTVQKITADEEGKPEESLAGFNGHTDMKSLKVEASAGVELIKESPINETTVSEVELPAEGVQELKVDEAAAAMSDTIADELSTTESGNIIEGPRLELIDSHVDMEESVEISLTAEPSVAEAAFAVSEPAAVVPKDLQIENDDIVHTGAVLVDVPPQTDNAVQEEAVAPLEETVVITSVDKPSVVDVVDPLLPTHNSVQEEVVAQTLESKEAVDDIPSTAEPSVVPTVGSEPTTAVLGELKTGNDEAEEDLVDVSSTAELSPAETEPATLAPEDLQIKNDEPEKDLVNPVPPTDNLVQTPLEEADETSYTTEPLATEKVDSEPATAVPEDPQIKNDDTPHAEELVHHPPPTHNLAQEDVAPPANDDIAQAAAEELVDPPPPIHNPAQETVVSLEPVEISATAEPTEAGTVLAVSEPTTVVQDLQLENDGPKEDAADPLLTHSPTQEEGAAPLDPLGISAVEPSVAETVKPENLQIVNDDIAQVEEDFVGPVPPTHKPVQEAIALLEVTEVSSTADSSVAETIVSDRVAVVLEDLQVGNDDIAPAGEDLVDSLPPTHSLVQEAAAPLGEATEFSSIAEPSMQEILSTVSEPSTENLHLENDPAEEDFIDPPPTHNLVQEEIVAPLEKAVEIPSTVEPSVTETAPVASKLSTEVPEDISIHNPAKAEDGLVNPPILRTVETELVGEQTGEVQTTITKTTVAEDTAVSQTTLSKEESQSFDEAEAEAPETHILNGNGHSATTQALEATSENPTPEEDDVKAEPQVIEPINRAPYPASASSLLLTAIIPDLDISATTIEIPSTTD